MMRRAWFALSVVVLALPSLLAAQRSSSVWIDASGAHSRPPAGAAVETSNYGLAGLRVRVDDRASAFELAGTFGRGVKAASGSWINGRGAYDASRVKGWFDAGVRAEANGLTYITPVELGGDTEYSQTMLSASVRPHAGMSIAGFRIGVEGTVTGGAWRSNVSTPVTGGGPFPPLPGSGSVDRRSERDDGSVSIIGAAASVLRVFGPASVEVRAAGYEARNQSAEGRYSGIDGTLGLSLGALDITAGARYWNTPLTRSETGGHAGVGVALGTGGYLRASVGRTVSDPLSGAAGSTSVSAGVSVRLGGSAQRPAIASVGAASGRGRMVTFLLPHGSARTVSVAGDFSGWEPRAMTRTGDTWKLETVLDTGVYHYSFIVDGETWMVPDDAAGIIDDGFGRRNATLIVNAASVQAGT